MIRSLYNWTLSLARHPHALWALAFVACLESSVFPIAPDVLMVAMIIANPAGAFVIAGVATVASVVGGIAGDWIGYGAFETLGRPVLKFYGNTDYFDEFQQRYNEWGPGRC